MELESGARPDVPFHHLECPGSAPAALLTQAPGHESLSRRGGPNNARGECLDMLVCNCIRLNSSPQKSTIKNNKQKIYSFVEFLRLRIMIYVGKESMELII